MRCYLHRDVDAVGICKCCSKGTCASCALPITNGVACSEACRPVAEDLSQLQLTNLRNAGLYRAQRVIQSMVPAGLVTMGVWSIYEYPSSASGWVASGLGLIIGAVLVRSSMRRKAR